MIRGMDEDEPCDAAGEGPDYRRPEQIGPSEFRNALAGLHLFNDDPYLRMQAFNLEIIDRFITGLEYDVLKKLDREEATPMPEAAFLSAQSQMWIFAAYEILRTWRQRARDIIKWADHGGLKAKLESYEKNLGYRHFGRQVRAAQIRRVLADSSIIDRIKVDLRRIHMLFAQLEAIRVSLAKHEVRGRAHSVALMPGYGRINQWCGSLEFEMENEAYSMGTISRRDIAEGIRALAVEKTPPTDEEIASFDAYMRGPKDAPKF
jgi:hypothetical protein